MLRDTHKAFAEKIAKELGFSEDNTWIFVDGSMGPDTHGDFPHDKGKSSKLLSKLDEARELYHFNDEYAYGELGNAIHYLQDRWVGNSKSENQLEIIDDKQLSTIVKQPDILKETTEEYESIIDSLCALRDKGIDQWFDFRWGIWHRDYSSCIFVFADIIELMLPTLQPNQTILSDKKKFKEYVGSEAFRKATKEGFLASIITNYLDPKLQGYPSAMYCLASITPPSKNRNFTVDFNIAYRLSLEIARYTVGKPELFKFQDSWTHKSITKKHMALSLVIPQYHVLIPKPVDEVHAERQWNFYEEKSKFLDEWPNLENKISELKRSDTWKLLVLELVKMLGYK